MTLGISINSAQDEKNKEEPKTLSVEKLEKLKESEVGSSFTTETGDTIPEKYRFLTFYQNSLWQEKKLRLLTLKIF